MTPHIRQATAADREHVVDTLVEAFIDDPVQRWIMSTPERRRRYGRHFFAMHARRMIPMGLAWTSEQGVSLWAPPDQWRESPVDTARLITRAFPGALPHPIRAVRGLLGMEALHPKDPHVYLAVVGVREEGRGQGLGSALIAPGLQHADSLGLPCYLESSNELNVPLYERHGFKVTREFAFPGGGPTAWLMWREPQR